MLPNGMQTPRFNSTFPVTVPEGASGICVNNKIGAAANLTITNVEGETWIVQAGCTWSAGINGFMSQLVITAAAGADGQVSYFY